ncbi:MAG: DUF4406 domain-containing protein [Mageeibacillus sp.]|jgi:hypothetical protein|nr:DUF4406 domain-containing protein [Mageeibacillus sp.]
MNGIFKYGPSGRLHLFTHFQETALQGTENAKRYSRYAVDAGAIPFAPHLLLPMYMKEDSERGQALYMDMVFLRRCDELWIFGENITSGMQAEIDQARKLGMKIRYFSENFKEETRHAI